MDTFIGLILLIGGFCVALVVPALGIIAMIIGGGILISKQRPGS